MNKQEPLEAEISLCPHCNCMTKTICGKCKQPLKEEHKLKAIDEVEVREFLYRNSVDYKGLVLTMDKETRDKLAKAICKTFGQKQIKLPKKIKHIYHDGISLGCIDCERNKIIDEVTQLNKDKP